MEKRYYDARSLRDILDAYEDRCGMRSSDFYAAYETDDERIAGLPGFLRHTWASFYRDWRRLGGDDLAASVRRELEIA